MGGAMPMMNQSQIKTEPSFGLQMNQQNEDLLNSFNITTVSNL